MSSNEPCETMTPTEQF